MLLMILPTSAAERQCTDWCLPSIFNRAEPVEPGEEEAVPCDPRPQDPPKVPPGVDCSFCWYVQDSPDNMGIGKSVIQASRYSDSDGTAKSVTVSKCHSIR